MRSTGNDGFFGWMLHWDVPKNGIFLRVLVDVDCGTHCNTSPYNKAFGNALTTVSNPNAVSFSGFVWSKVILDNASQMSGNGLYSMEFPIAGVQVTALQWVLKSC